jgi:uncharacterized lipoprotein YehR (DUF1307 family)
LRPNDKFKDFVICKKINDDVFKTRGENEVLIDTTGQTAEETAAKILEQVRNTE